LLLLPTTREGALRCTASRITGGTATARCAPLAPVGARCSLALLERKAKGLWAWALEPWSSSAFSALGWFSCVQWHLLSAVRCTRRAGRLAISRMAAPGVPSRYGQMGHSYHIIQWGSVFGMNPLKWHELIEVHPLDCQFLSAGGTHFLPWSSQTLPPAPPATRHQHTSPWVVD
jgi:hypothetical protein